MLSHRAEHLRRASPPRGREADLGFLFLAARTLELLGEATSGSLLRLSARRLFQVSEPRARPNLRGRGPQKSAARRRGCT